MKKCKIIFLIFLLFSCIVPLGAQIYPTYRNVQQGFFNKLDVGNYREYTKIAILPKPKKFSIESARNDKIFSVALWESLSLVCAVYARNGIKAHDDVILVAWDLSSQEIIFEKRIFVSDQVELEYSFFTNDTSCFIINVDPVTNEYILLDIKKNRLDSLNTITCDSLTRLGYDCPTIVDSKRYSTLVIDSTNTFIFASDKDRKDAYVSIFVTNDQKRIWKRELVSEKINFYMDSLINRNDINDSVRMVLRDSLYQVFRTFPNFMEYSEVKNEELGKKYLPLYWGDKKLK